MRFFCVGEKKRERKREMVARKGGERGRWGEPEKKGRHTITWMDPEQKLPNKTPPKLHAPSILNLM